LHARKHNLKNNGVVIHSETNFDMMNNDFGWKHSDLYQFPGAGFIKIAGENSGSTSTDRTKVWLSDDQTKLVCDFYHTKSSEKFIFLNPNFNF